MSFLFGLVHGFGFSSVLRELGLPTQGRPFSLLSFNLGVEVGQAAASGADPSAAGVAAAVQVGVASGRGFVSAGAGGRPGAVGRAGPGRSQVKSRSDPRHGRSLDEDVMSFAYWNVVRTGAWMVAAVLAWNGSAGAQSGSELSEAQLRGPWEQHLAVLQSLSGSIGAASDAQARSELADTLATLQVALGEYQRQVDEVIDRILADPQFSYAAAETSQAPSAQLAEVHADFDHCTGLGVREREDVHTAQASLDALRKVLLAKTAFERDVLTALASSSQQQIVGLATRWWTARNGRSR